MDLFIEHDGEVWRVLSTGAERDGMVYCHLASTTKFRAYKNGLSPVQIADWVAVEQLGCV